MFKAAKRVFFQVLKDCWCSRVVQEKLSACNTLLQGLLSTSPPVRQLHGNGMLQSCHPSCDEDRRALPDWRDFPHKLMTPGSRGWQFCMGKNLLVVAAGENSLLSSKQP